MNLTKLWFIVISAFTVLLWIVAVANAVYLFQYHVDDDFIEDDIRSDIGLDSLVSSIDLKNAFNARIEIQDSTSFTILIEDKQVFSTEKQDYAVLTSFSNNSYRSAIYSLSFIRNSLYSGQWKNFTKEHWKSLEKVMNEVLSSGERIPQTDKYVFYDHPVSERLETLLLLKLCLRDNKIKLDFPFDKYIPHLITLLNNDDFFNSTMNHGLMQLRSQLFYVLITGNKKPMEKVKQRLERVLPIYVNDDGSLLEAATGYQLYIYEQFKLIKKLLLMAGEESIYLSESLDAQRTYLKSLVNSDGFMQGMGDSYSVYINDSGLLEDKSHIYSYSNKIVGIDSKTLKDETYALQVVSFDNKPNVHKLSEDLAVYIYHTEPLFANTGTYTYQNSLERKFILSDDSQNGPKFSSKRVSSSWVTSMSAGFPIEIQGWAESEGDTMGRLVSLQKDMSVTIVDSAENEITSRFIIHPDIEIDIENNHTILLSGREIRYSLTTNVVQEIIPTWVAEGYEKKKNSKMVVLKGKNIRVEIDPLMVDSLESFVRSVSISDSIPRPDRFAVSNQLRKDYPFSMLLWKIYIGYGVFLLILFLGNMISYIARWKWVTILLNVVLVSILVRDICCNHFFVVEFIYDLKNHIL